MGEGIERVERRVRWGRRWGQGIGMKGKKREIRSGGKDRFVKKR